MRPGPEKRPASPLRPTETRTRNGNRNDEVYLMSANGTGQGNLTGEPQLLRYRPRHSRQRSPAAEAGRPLGHQSGLTRPRQGRAIADLHLDNPKPRARSRRRPRYRRHASAGAQLSSVDGGSTNCTSGATVRCAAASLASGASATVRIVVQPSAQGSLHNQASVSASTSDPNNGNNSAIADTTVQTGGGGSSQCHGQAATITGTPGADVLTGTEGPDVIAAGAGDDDVAALGGNDTVCGGAGEDLLAGGPGNDLLDGHDDSTSDDASSDAIDYSTSTQAVVVRLASGQAIEGTVTGEGQDRVQRVSDVIGSPGSDDIQGNDNPNWIAAGAGDDRISRWPRRRCPQRDGWSRHVHRGAG